MNITAIGYALKIDTLNRSIEAQAKLIKNKRDRGTARGVIEANSDLEELEQHYRRIGALFRQLQASVTLLALKPPLTAAGS